MIRLLPAGSSRRGTACIAKPIPPRLASTQAVWSGRSVTSPTESATGFRVSSLAIVATNLDNVLGEGVIALEIGIDQLVHAKVIPKRESLTVFTVGRDPPFGLRPVSCDLLLKLNAIGQEGA